MSKTDNLPRRIYDLYADGFRHMTIGRTLWTIIIIKLVIIFIVLRLLLLPDFLAKNAGQGCKDDYVATEMIKRGETAGLSGRRGDNVSPETGKTGQDNKNQTDIPTTTHKNNKTK